MQILQRLHTVGVLSALALATVIAAIPSAQQSDVGIFVGEPKIYDDQSLQIMLNAARAQLSALRPIDQASLIARIGSVQGADLRQTSVGVQFNGLPSPSNATTSTTATPSPVVTSDTTTTTPADATKASTTVENKTVTTTPSATVQNVLTQPSVTPSAPAAPVPTTSLPSAFNVSALQTLNEQMQLTYEIANLQLLLEGSLSDRFSRHTNLLKPHTTVGFPISIETPAGKEYTNAVAEVDVTVWNRDIVDESPSLMTILPRQRTYNVANITDRSFSVGGGIVTGLASIGATWLWGHKTYYLVQDQDTIALQRPESEAGYTRFAWQFRPVLGQKALRGGLRQTFAQLAFQTELSERSCFGSVGIVTHWRRFDPKTGAVGETIKSSDPIFYPLANFDLRPQASSVTVEDVGGANVLVTIAGNFLSGTRVRLGSTYLDESGAGFVLKPKVIQFTTSATLLASSRPKLVTRDGTENDILESNPAVGGQLPPLLSCSSSRRPARLAGKTNSNTPQSAPVAPPAKPQPARPVAVPPTDLVACPQAVPKPPPTAHVLICKVQITPYTDSQSTLSIQLLKAPDDPARRNPLVVLVGNRLFGLSDAPFLHATTDRMQFIAPNDLLRNSRKLTVKRLFWGDNFSADAPLPLTPDSAITKLTLLTVVGAETVFAVSGAHAEQVHIQIPEAGTRLVSVDGTTTLMYVQTDKLKDLKYFVLRLSAEPPVVLAVPDDAKPQAPKPSLKSHVPIQVTSTSVPFTINGTALDAVKQINYLKTVIPFALALDKQSITLSLPVDITQTTGIRFLDVLFTDGTSMRYQIEVSTKK